MKTTRRAWQGPLLGPRLFLGLGLIALGLTGCATSEPTPPPPLSVSTRGAEQIFPTPEQAANALAEANRRNDKAALLKILGKNGAALVSSGDPVADKESRARFVAAYDTAHKLEIADDGREYLIIGDEEWPLPIPLIHVVDSTRASGGWQFDTETGAQEIINRRIGRDEINAIKICRVYVVAQREYAEQHPLPDGTPEYAQHFMSKEGTHDGLYWPTKDGEEESPLGPLVADARAEGYKTGDAHHNPYHGYYYKILKGQGPSAAGGSVDYVVNGHMTRGFALLAFPAKYGDSGIMSFIVDQNGIVFEKNLGPDTAERVKHINRYNPDSSWKITASDQP